MLWWPSVSANPPGRILAKCKSELPSPYVNEVTRDRSHWNTALMSCACSCDARRCLASSSWAVPGNAARVGFVHDLEPTPLRLLSSSRMAVRWESSFLYCELGARDRKDVTSPETKSSTLLIW